MDIAHQALLSMRFSRQEYWSGLPFTSLGDLPDLGIEPVSPGLKTDSLLLSHLGRSFVPAAVYQLLSGIQLFATPCTAACQASLSFSISQSLLKFMSTESMMPSNHLILCYPFSSCLQYFPASGSFLMNQLFASGSQTIGASASTSVLPMNIQH